MARKKNHSFMKWLCLACFIFVVWYAYCHYFPILLNSSAKFTSADIVENEYRFADINNTHLSAARRVGIKPVANREQLETNTLSKIRSGNHYTVDCLTHSVPYLTPASAKLLDEIGTRFQKELQDAGFEKHRIIVTSILRTEEDVKALRKTNSNASKNSAHQYATTFDIAYTRFDRQSLFGKPANNKQLANILGHVLEQLRKEGLCYVKYERKRRCFHITSRR